MKPSPSPGSRRARARAQARRSLRSRSARQARLKLKQSAFRRDFPDEIGPFGQPDRKAVCRRCRCVMRDFEPLSSSGEFRHPSLDKDGKPHWCRNAGLEMSARDMELVPFLPKSRRRYLKRAGIRP